MAEAIKVKDGGIIYKHKDDENGKLKILWKSRDVWRLIVVLANNYPGKIVTAYWIPQKDWNIIVNEGEKIAR